ncbi:MAG: NAD(P)/FAD-dependent oxidoreductase [Thermomicrobiales bacterium]
MSSRFIVVGGGIVGASAAFHLAQAGAEAVLADRADLGQATAAGAGIISPGPSRHDADAFFLLAKPAVTYYPELVQSLTDVAQANTGYEVVGELFLAENEEQVTDLDDVSSRILNRRESGMPNIGELSWVDQDQARSYFPAVGNVERAIHIAGAARVDGGLMRDALMAGALRHGAMVRHGAASLLMNGDRVTGVVVDGEAIEADSVVLAGGAWTNGLLNQLGYQLPVAPQRGQIVHIRMGDTDTSKWPILAWFGDQYILTFGPNRVVAGATRESGSGFDVRQTPGGVKHVLDTALRIAPGLAEGTLSEIRIGLRPYSEDGVPFLGKMPGHDNVVIATGHGPSGLMLGPYSGLVAANLLLDRQVNVDLSSFRVERGLTEVQSD